MDSYATTDQLTARLSSAYSTPADAEALLLKASELIDYATMGRSAYIADHDTFPDGSSTTDQKTELANATCDQVEYWLEVGEETDVVGLQPGSAVALGRLQVQKLPSVLGRRTIRTLTRAGIYWAGGGVQ